jgi:2-polyprenyl-3-methyl-5-hydroxy-6-metoxy-1,4-benzoquinol methylase
MAMDSYQITFQTWNKVATLYQDKFMNLDLYNDTYDRFCELVEKWDPAIFEIGCGPGNITKYLLAKRPDFQIKAIDVAPNMIELAKANNPTVQFSVLDCRDIGRIQSKYDAIIAGFCLPYLSKEDTAKFLKNCAGLLYNGGILYFSTIKGDYVNSGFVTGSTGDRCYIYYYKEDDLRHELAQCNFEVLEVKHKTFSKEDGTASEDMVFIAMKK